jgi:hypothetical protein
MLSEKIYSHIHPDNLQCSKITVSMMRNFRRGELLLRRWNGLKHQVVWLGQSTLEINRDSVFIVVRDRSIPVREELTDEELIKYCTP